MLVAVCVLLFAILLDIIVGDPSPNSPWKSSYRLHPTVLMGKYIKALESRLKNPNPRREKFNGILLGLVVILTFSLPVFFGLWAIYAYLGAGWTWLGIIAYAIVGIFLLKLTICIKLETDWAKAAAKAIQANDLEEARKYSHFSRRDSTNLNGALISSAVIESMAENLIDFKLSPITSYVFLGVTGAVAFRAVNTLDGMVGFKDKEHINMGWFSANLDTVVNYIPTRLAALLMIAASAIIGYDWRNAWQIAKRDHAKTPSRNHGWPMGAIAGALRVQFVKPGQYSLGDPQETLTSDKILGALRIRNVTIVLWILLSLPVLFLIRFYVFPF
ncbi:MAG TPA: cobalamin biosynthesis protein [Candidatus Bathyarchaeia archaeon]|nr:cobalamin biosynthesis protein [Candidatus Bathyarchaeia archaeon]